MFFESMRDVLDGDDRRIDQDADRNRQARERHDIRFHVDDTEDAERPDDRENGKHREWQG